MKTGLWIVHIITALLFGIALELNHNRILGWVLFLAAVILFPVVMNRVNGGWFKALTFLVLFGCYGMIFKFTWPVVTPVSASDSTDVTDIIHTDHGDITGVYNKDHTVEVYAGIPYAKAPVGELRWKKPQDNDSWTGVRACNHFAPMSMQVVNAPIMDSLTRIIGYHDYRPFTKTGKCDPVSEDSLYLNIWKPVTGNTSLPVIVYIHGGSLQTGQPWYEAYNGESFAEDGVITVNMGYRLGVFGFLATDELVNEEGTAGNFGLLDQIKALEWVKANIASFGGDPDNITLIGESAGAACVDALCVSELAEGLFTRAVLESSTLSSVNPPHSFRLFEEALTSGRDLLSRYHCSSMEELRSIPAETLVSEMNTQHHITVDGYVLTDTPYNLRKQGIHNESALLHGFNGEESGPFIMFSKATLKTYEEKVRAAFGDAAEDILKAYPVTSDEEADRTWAMIYGGLFFNYSHYCLNRLANENSIPVYEYLFTKDNGSLGDWHSGELVYAFARIPESSGLYTTEDLKLSAMMHQYWINFAKTSNPNSEGLPVFEENTTDRMIMEFGDNIGMIEEPYLRLYAILDRCS